MKSKPLPPLEELKEFLDYNPDTGVITWIKNRSGVKLGQVAGTINTLGYVIILFTPYRSKLKHSEKFILAHRVAYYMYYGVDPLEKMIDHIDGNRSNNKINNLRLATNQQNLFNQGLSKNNTSGIKGVSWSNEKQKWVAQIFLNGRNIILGRYTHKEDAIKTRKEAEINYHGKFRKQD